jgi:hypothetical protein
MKKILFKFLANPTSKVDFYDGLILFAFTLVLFIGTLLLFSLYNLINLI